MIGASELRDVNEDGDINDAADKTGGMVSPGRAFGSGRWYRGIRNRTGLARNAGTGDCGNRKHICSGGLDSTGVFRDGKPVATPVANYFLAWPSSRRERKHMRCEPGSSPVPAGLGLIEMMISLVIGALVLLGTVSLFQQSRRAVRKTNGCANAGKGRFALRMLSRELSMMGYWGGILDAGESRTRRQCWRRMPHGLGYWLLIRPSKSTPRRRDSELSAMHRPMPTSSMERMCSP